MHTPSEYNITISQPDKRMESGILTIDLGAEEDELRILAQKPILLLFRNWNMIRSQME